MPMVCTILGLWYLFRITSAYAGQISNIIAMCDSVSYTGKHTVVSVTWVESTLWDCACSVTMEVPGPSNANLQVIVNTFRNGCIEHCDWRVNIYNGGCVQSICCEPNDRWISTINVPLILSAQIDSETEVYVTLETDKVLTSSMNNTWLEVNIDSVPVSGAIEPHTQFKTQCGYKATKVISQPWREQCRHNPNGTATYCEMMANSATMSWIVPEDANWWCLLILVLAVTGLILFVTIITITIICCCWCKSYEDVDDCASLITDSSSSSIEEYY